MPTDIEDVIKDPRPLDEDDEDLLKYYGLGPFSTSIKKVEKDVKDMAKRIEELFGSKMSHTDLSAPLQGSERYSTSIEKAIKDSKDLTRRINELCGILKSDTSLSAPLEVARCTKIINSNTEDANDEKLAEVLVELGDKVSPNDIKEG